MGQRRGCAVNGSRGPGRSVPVTSALPLSLPAVRADQPCLTVFAASAAQVSTDHPDNESDMVSRRGTEFGIATSRDDFAFHDRHRLGDQLTVFIDPNQALGIPARCHHVELDPPPPPTSPEIKAPAAPASFPLP